MNKSTTVDIGLNTCCFTRRWEETDNWIRLSKEAGYDYVQIDSDALDPFFSGDTGYQLAVADEIRRKTKQYGVSVRGYYTGMASYRFHGISHSDPSARDRMKEWVERAVDLAAAMGTDMVGGRFDAFSVETLGDPVRHEKQMEKTIRMYRDISVYAKKKGLYSLELEQMYVPSLVPYQMEQAQEYYRHLNRENDGCRITITVDVGHMAGQNYGNMGADLSYIEWLKHFGAMSECIHIQQTPQKSSAHWPFTEEYNEKGCIEVEQILEALRYSHAHWQEEPWAEYVSAQDRNILILEYIPSTADSEEEILESIGESNYYLRKFIPREGIVI